MQLWRLDMMSLVSLALILALVSSLPFRLALSVLIFEALYGMVGAPLRYRRLNRRLTGSPEPAYSSCYSAESDLDLDSSSASSLVHEGLQLLHQLLDPTEAHAELLRNATWFEGWWEGASTSELGLGNISEFLSYTLFSKRTLRTTRLLHNASLKFIEALGLHIQDDSSGGEIAGGGASDKEDQAKDSCSNNHNPRARFIAHTEEPLKVVYRPLAFYLMTEAVAGWSHVQLTQRQGFTIARRTSIATYYSHIPAPGGAAAADPPIVFLHGIGLGLAPYTAFLRRLVAQHPGRSIVAVQYKHVSMRMTNRIPTATEVADDVATFLEEQGLTRANIIGHSYGTLVASSLAKRHASLIAGLTLIDPVCFAMFLPHLVSHTLHFDAWKVQQPQPNAVAGPTGSTVAGQLEPLKKPKHLRWQPWRWQQQQQQPGAMAGLLGSIEMGQLEQPMLRRWQPWRWQQQQQGAMAGLLGSTAAGQPEQPKPRRWQPVRSLMRGLVLRELHCAAAMSRRFRWSDLNLWTSDIPANTTVVLGGCDTMIPAAQILQMVTSSAAAARGVHVIFNPEHGHGSFLMHPELQNRIAVAGSVAAGSPAAAESAEADADAVPLPEVAAGRRRWLRGPRRRQSGEPMDVPSRGKEDANPDRASGPCKPELAKGSNSSTPRAVRRSKSRLPPALLPGTAAEEDFVQDIVAKDLTELVLGAAGKRRSFWPRVQRLPLLLLPRVRLPPMPWRAGRRQARLAKELSQPSCAPKLF